MRNYLIPFVVCLLFVSCSNNKEIKDPNDFNIEVAKSFIDKNDMFGNNVTSFFQGYWISINQQKILIEDFFGIPIFISYDNKGYLSVEHNHPPSEYFFNNKIKGQKILKEKWFSQLP